MARRSCSFSLVVVGGGLLDLGLDLGHARLDRLGIATTVNEGGVVLGRNDAAGRAEVLGGNRVELAAELLADDVGTAQDGHVTQHFLAPIAKAGRLDGEHADRALELVDDQRGERLTVDVFGDEEQRLAQLDGLLERRQELLDARDLLVGDQDGRVLENGLHAIGIGHEVGRDVAPVELHALGVLGLEAQRLALLDGDDAVLADLVHHLGDDVADLGICGADRGHGRDLLAAVHRTRVLLELLDEALDALVRAALDDHRVGAGGHVLETLGDHRLAEHDRGGGAVAGDVVGLGRDFLEQLRAHVLERIFELDVARDRHAVIGDRRRAELLVEDDVAALGAERHLDRVGELVYAALE